MRFSSALKHGARALLGVRIHLLDVNGPQRGGVDKRCGVELRFTRGGTVVLEETDSDLYVAIDKAAGRSKQALLKRIERFRSRRRDRQTRY